ncbi:MAG: transcriptional regulator, partial [Spirochaetota bacterium]
MDDTHFKLEAKENFLKMHHKSIFSDLFHIIRANEHNKLLSFYDVRSLLGDAKQEKYLGIQVIPVDKIIGSEGRYQDFTRSFLPKSKHLQERWVNIRTAAQKDINLPPIQLYKLGDAYFVRDGNHRVSVARSSGIEMIDAEVTQIISPIYVSADMTHKEILRRVIQYEKGIVFKQTRLANFIGTEDLTVTSPGSYSLIIQ